MASGYPDEALQDFNHAIQLQPDFPQAYSNRGNAYNRKGRIDLAIPDFIRARTISPSFIIILLAVILFGAWIVYRAVRRRML